LERFNNVTNLVSVKNKINYKKYIKTINNRGFDEKMPKNNDFSVHDLEKIILAAETKVKGVKKPIVAGENKQSFVDTGTSYIAKKIIFRIVKDDGKTEDIVKEYSVPIEFHKNVINKLTKSHNGKDWMIITDVVTDEKDLVFVLHPIDVKKIFEESVKKPMVADEVEDEYEDEYEDVTEEIDVEKIFEEALEQIILESDLDISRVSTFAEAGIMTNNKGLVVEVRGIEDLNTGKYYDGPFEFQLTITG
jgi:hypothetical protein